LSVLIVVLNLKRGTMAHSMNYNVILKSSYISYNTLWHKCENDIHTSKDGTNQRFVYGRAGDQWDDCMFSEGVSTLLLSWTASTHFNSTTYKNKKLLRPQ